MDSIVQTRAGKLRGRRDEAGPHVFLGVRYAEPPLGEHRLLAPVPVTAWDGIRDALGYGPTAPQPDQEFTLIPEPVVRGEDFLNLNVFTPEPGGAGLPVLVWIHGGGFFAGCNRSPWYRGESFARDGVVLVSVNYRLGAEGFLTAEGAPSNRGALDWLAALVWVQENIAAFGGDPDRVTIAGQSAGGAACATLLATHRAQGLFGQAILMSGAAHMSVTPDAARELARKLAGELGIEPTRDGFARIGAEDLVAAQQRLASLSMTGDAVSTARRMSAGLLPFGPTPDGELLDRTPIEQIAAGAGASLPVLVGNTSQEFNMMGAMGGAGLDEPTLRAALGAMGLSADQVEAHVEAGAGQAPATLFAQAITDRTFRIPAVRVAEARAPGPAKTFAYEFRWPSPAMGGLLGAGHCVDLPFAFDLLHADGVSAVLGDSPPQPLADAMHGAWVRFITDGEPGWPAYEPDHRTTMIFDTDSGVQDDPVCSVRGIWDGVL
jgi:para-nitrobenzyl esterase